MFGMTFEKLLMIGVIAVFLLGPERLPHYAAQLARLVRSLRDMANGARERMKDEMGEDFEEIDWRKLDPRQYDPRRIIREALADADPFSDSGPKPALGRSPSVSDAQDANTDSIPSGVPHQTTAAAFLSNRDVPATGGAEELDSPAAPAPADVSATGGVEPVGADRAIPFDSEAT